MTPLELLENIIVFIQPLMHTRNRKVMASIMLNLINSFILVLFLSCALPTDVGVVLVVELVEICLTRFVESRSIMYGFEKYSYATDTSINFLH